MKLHQFAGNFILVNRYMESEKIYIFLAKSSKKYRNILFRGNVGRF